jgi:hypothetical protein
MVAGPLTVAAHVVGVNGRLIPVKVDYDVAETRGAGRSERLAHPTARQPALALDDMDHRRIVAVTVAQAESQADGARHAYAGGAGGQPDEWRRRRWVTVQGPAGEPAEQRCRGDGIAPEPEQVLQTQTATVIGRQQRRPAVRGDEAAGRDGAAGVARGRDIVEQDGAERAVVEVHPIERGQLRLGERRSADIQSHTTVDEDPSPGTERKRHGHFLRQRARACVPPGGTPAAPGADREPLVSRACRRTHKRSQDANPAVGRRRHAERGESWREVR